MFAWNFGDIVDGVSAVIPPDAPALIHGDRVIRWGEATARSNRLARALLARGAVAGDKVAFYMHNRPEYTETLAACFKARLVHVNVNYRYTPDEVHYIFDNSDATTVVYGEEFRRNIEAIRPRLSKVQHLRRGRRGRRLRRELRGAVRGGRPVAAGDRAQRRRLFFIYTGGTTGMPKGVMWTHNDLRQITLMAARALGPVPETLDELVAAARVTGLAPAASSPRR